MKRLVTWLLLPLFAIGLLTILSTQFMRAQRHADAAPEALAMAASDDEVIVESGRYLVLRPRHVAERMGVVFYPGAYVDVRGYLPTLRPIAAAGYRVVIVPMPMELAIYGLDRAGSIIAANPSLQRWALIGHSVGGAMTGIVARLHPDALQGIIIWDSYPALSLQDFSKPVWHIHRATLDGAPPPAFAAHRDAFGPNSHWVAIPGGIHMYFGSFVGGGYQEDWAPQISRQEQHARVVAATLQALQAMFLPDSSR
jgi:pimeloyl-ACP methyl ester carboxylesterase